MFPDDVVDGSDEADRQVRSQEVGGRSADHGVDLVVGNRDVTPLVAIPDDPVVGRDAIDGLRIDSGEPNFVTRIACSQPRIDMEEFDVCNFHGLTSERDSHSSHYVKPVRDGWLRP